MRCCGPDGRGRRRAPPPTLPDATDGPPGRPEQARDLRYHRPDARSRPGADRSRHRCPTHHVHRPGRRTRRGRPAGALGDRGDRRGGRRPDPRPDRASSPGGPGTRPATSPRPSCACAPCRATRPSSAPPGASPTTWADRATTPARSCSGPPGRSTGCSAGRPGRSRPPPPSSTPPGSASSVWIARRRGGTPLAWWAAIILVLLLGGYAIDGVSQPWNPWISLLPFSALLFAVWSVLDGDRWMLPVAVFAGSYALQGHIGYLALVPPLLLLAVGSLAWQWWSGRRTPSGSPAAPASPRPAARPGGWSRRSASASSSALVALVGSDSSTRDPHTEQRPEALRELRQPRRAGARALERSGGAAPGPEPVRRRGSSAARR